MQKVRVHNEERAKEWKEMLGTDEVPVVSIIPQEYDLPIGKTSCYLLDVKKLSEKQKENIINRISKKFNLDQEFVRKDITQRGVPIPVEDCIAASDEILRYL